MIPVTSEKFNIVRENQSANTGYQTLQGPSVSDIISGFQSLSAAEVEKILVS